MRERAKVLFIVTDEVEETVDEIIRVLCVFEDSLVDVRAGDLPTGHVEIDLVDVKGVMLKHVCDAIAENNEHVRCVLYDVGILEYVKWLRHEVMF